MLLLLARHGNTFEKGDKVVWVGARTDLPLTAKGKAQAEALGHAFSPLGARIKRIIAGPLKRTVDHASIAARIIGFQGTVAIDERLKEIDYGLWEAKSSDEIEALGGENALSRWNEHSEWPSCAGWRPSPEVISNQTRDMATELALTLTSDDAALLVSSNGILRFFLDLVPTLASANRRKVAPGNYCALNYENGNWELINWNKTPETIDF